MAFSPMWPSFNAVRLERRKSGMGARTLPEEKSNASILSGLNAENQGRVPSALFGSESLLQCCPA